MYPFFGEFLGMFMLHQLWRALEIQSGLRFVVSTFRNRAFGIAGGMFNPHH